jgi:hypothetical protein
MAVTISPARALPPSPPPPNSDLNMYRLTLIDATEAALKELKVTVQP